jgi:hypothetical protein
MEENEVSSCSNKEKCDDVGNIREKANLIKNGLINLSSTNKILEDIFMLNSYENIKNQFTIDNTKEISKFIEICGSILDKLSEDSIEIRNSLDQIYIKMEEYINTADKDMTNIAGIFDEKFDIINNLSNLIKDRKNNDNIVNYFKDNVSSSITNQI